MAVKSGKRSEKRRRRIKTTGLVGADREQAIIDLIRAVPEGFVTTYSDLCPEAPRLPGRVLATTTEKVPWHRIVRSDGTFAQGERQRRLLRREGIPFAGKRVDMDAAHLPREALLENL
jgi:alkylated DNA nucleotide flippase Atl1